MGSPVTGNVGQSSTPTVTEFQAANPSVLIPPIGPLAFASDNTAVATVDPASGVVTLVSAGTANVSCIDQGNNLTDTVAFTVNGGPPPPPPTADTMSLSYSPAALKRR